MDQQTLITFQNMIWNYYQSHGRDFPWRNTEDPYHIVISEIMLQQTQTFRVEQKYEQFVRVFDNFEAIASASLHDVLALWQGLGYNRRAKMVHELAKKVIHEHNGILPADPALLETFPGIGKATASSICAFAFNLPTVFIETNIRTVFIAHFFKDKERVDDRDIMPLVAQTVDQNNPRHWYYALMDYGVFIKKETNNSLARKSKHYTLQSQFQGSDRQIRGKILRILIDAKKIEKTDLLTIIDKNNERTERILDQLIKEGLVKQINNQLSID